MIAALFVLERGPYFGLVDIDPWDKARDARKYSGPYRVIAHPPCERWGRYWGGGPSVKVKRKMGDDDGCFASALHSVRAYGGVLEHPEASHAFKRFGLMVPDWHGGWSGPDRFGGMVCCVSQGHYGHQARKLTWLYAVNCKLFELVWGPTKSKIRLDLGFHSAAERKRAIKTGVCQRLSQRLSQRQRKLTPIPFRDLLIEIVGGK